MKLLAGLLLLGSIVYAKDIKVLVIDSGIDTSHPEVTSHLLNYTDNPNYIDTYGHGTHIAGIITNGTCKQIKVISCRAFFPELFDTVECLQMALDLKVKYVNLSGGGKPIIFEERELISKLTKKKVKVIVAAGNDNSNSLDYYPAGYNMPGLIVVGNLNQDGTRHRVSNYGFKNMVWEIGTEVESTLPNGKFGKMTGTSQATAVHTNRLLRLECLKLK